MQVPDQPEDDILKGFNEHSSKLQAYANFVDNFEVTDHESLEKAEQVLHVITEIYDIVESITERFRKPAYEYYQRVLSEKKDILAYPKSAIEGLRSRVEAYMLESGDDDIDSVSLRTRWKARLTEPTDQALMMLCSAIASGEAPVDLVKLNQKYADKVAGMLMDNMSYAGLEAYQDTTLVMRKDG